MSERLSRLWAVVRADFFIRLRRPSTAVVFVLLSTVPYLWIPDPATNRALIQIGGRRALYNSAAIGMATATIATIFIGLFGFYVISNALRRDVLTRCGYVIASTTMRGSEYLAGKFAGNVFFLSIFTGGFMLTSMVMVLVRGEAPLEPLPFMRQYLLLLPPVIAAVSAVAVLFECTPLLRTKFGDVLYFFVFVGSLGVVVSSLERHSGPNWLVYLDYSGMGLIFQQMREYYGTNSLSIGASPWDHAKGTMVFDGLRADARWLVQRAGATLWPVALLAVARVFFHRFDPARVRAVPNEKARRSWLGRLNLLAKPVARLFAAAGERVASLAGSAAFLRAAMTDAVTTVASLPLVAVGAIGFAIAALAVSDANGLFVGVLPIAFAGAAIAIADVASREKRSGTLALVFAAPSLRTRFVLWKFVSAVLVAAMFLAVPLACAIVTRPAAAMPLLVGMLFVSAAATAFGIVSANPKTFLVLFLTLWYVCMNDKGQWPLMDFAGWFGAITPQLVAGYAIASMALLAIAHAFHLRELARRW
jgi:hypothetical protein